MNLSRSRQVLVAVSVVLALVLVTSVWFLSHRADLSARTGPTAQGSEAPRPAQPSTPAAGSTGVPAGTVLEPVDGSLHVTRPGQVLDALDVSGGIVIDAPDVVITRSKVHGSGSDPYGILVQSGSVTVSDSEIFDFANGIGHDNWTAYRVDIHNVTEDGVKLGSNVTLADSYIHDITPHPGAHSDGAQMQSAASALVVRGNVIDVSGGPGAERMNSALFLKPDFGPSSSGPVTIEGNYLNGGGYVLYCTLDSESDVVVENITISGNRFGRAFGYGPADVSAPITQEDNVWDDTGQPLGL